jgi:hypothetical protein
MPTYNPDGILILDKNKTLISDEVAYDLIELKQELDENIVKLNVDQRKPYNTIVYAVQVILNYIVLDYIAFFLIISYFLAQPISLKCILIRFKCKMMRKTKNVLCSPFLGYLFIVYLLVNCFLIYYYL